MSELFFDIALPWCFSEPHQPLLQRHSGLLWCFGHRHKGLLPCFCCMRSASLNIPTRCRSLLLAHRLVLVHFFAPSASFAASFWAALVLRPPPQRVIPLCFFCVQRSLIFPPGAAASFLHMASSWCTLLRLFFRRCYNPLLSCKCTHLFAIISPRLCHFFHVSIPRIQ